jgi:hypothetical protein
MIDILVDLLMSLFELLQYILSYLILFLFFCSKYSGPVESLKHKVSHSGGRVVLSYFQVHPTAYTIK